MGTSTPFTCFPPLPTPYFTNTTLTPLLSSSGLTNGAAITTSLIALISNAQPADQAIATACSYLFRSLGSVLGLSILSATVQQQLRVRLRDALGSGAEADAIVRNVRESLDYIRGLDPSVAQLVRQAYGESIRDGFGLVCGLVVCACIAACEFSSSPFFSSCVPPLLFPWDYGV